MRRVDGQMKRHTLGTYPALTLAEARTAAAKELVRMASGEHDKPTEGRLFRAVFEDWMARDQAENRTLRQVRIAMEVHVLPKLAKRKIEDIKKGEHATIAIPGPFKQKAADTELFFVAPQYITKQQGKFFCVLSEDEHLGLWNGIGPYAILFIPIDSKPLFSPHT